MDLQPFEEMKERYQIAFVIGVALTISAFVFGGIVFWMRGSGIVLISMPPTISGILRIIFLGLSLVGLLMMPLIHSFVLGPRTTDKPIYMDAELWPSYIQRMFRASITVCLVSEAPALLGLVLFLLTQTITDFLLLAMVSVLCFVFYFPRYEQWEYELRRIS